MFPTLNIFAMLSALVAISTALGPGGRGEAPSGPDQTFLCPNAGYFCAKIKSRPYGMTSYALQSPISPLVSIVPKPLPEAVKGEGEEETVKAKFYSCSSSNARSVPIAHCPQNECVQGYCAGGGPATVPERLRGGDGLYCGRTIIDQIHRGQRSTYTEESPSKGGGGGGGGGDGSYDEYVSDNLYYFSGNQGFNLGPCERRCVSAGRGQADYCEAPPGRL